MSTPTVENSRCQALLQRIAGLEAQAPRQEAVALGLVDAMLDGDDETLAASLDALRDARGRADGERELVGWLDAAIAFAHWGLERTPPRAPVAGGTQAHEFLDALGGAPQLGSAELARLLETDDTQVSRTGRRLLESGLVARRKVGRRVFWVLTPRGRQALEQAPPRRRSPNSEVYREAIRRGFEAASGDGPAEPREVDPTRERIIASTLALHQSQGIRATTWGDIAGKASVPIETVNALFPTFDDLTRSCGEHLMETLQVPPSDRAPEVFADASSESERVRRLVETFFGVYERGGEGLTAGRRERKDVPAVDEAFGELDDVLDSLVTEALRPLDSGSVSVASLRALTDLEVWRVLRDQGATPGAAVDQASATVERWLEARPLSGRREEPVGSIA